MNALDSVQTNRLTTHLRGLVQTPEWRDIKRFIVAASADDNPGFVDEVAAQIKGALTIVVDQEVTQAKRLRGRLHG